MGEDLTNCILKTYSS